MWMDEFSWWWSSWYMIFDKYLALIPLLPATHVNIWWGINLFSQWSQTVTQSSRKLTGNSIKLLRIVVPSLEQIAQNFSCDHGSYDNIPAYFLSVSCHLAWLDLPKPHIHLVYHCSTRTVELIKRKRAIVVLSRLNAMPYVHHYSRRCRGRNLQDGTKSPQLPWVFICVLLRLQIVHLGLPSWQPIVNIHADILIMTFTVFHPDIRICFVTEMNYVGRYWWGWLLASFGSFVPFSLFDWFGSSFTFSFAPFGLFGLQSDILVVLVIDIIDRYILFFSWLIWLVVLCLFSSR